MNVSLLLLNDKELEAVEFCLTMKRAELPIDVLEVSIHENLRAYTALTIAKELKGDDFYQFYQLYNDMFDRVNPMPDFLKGE